MFSGTAAAFPTCGLQPDSASAEVLEGGGGGLQAAGAVSVCQLHKLHTLFRFNDTNSCLVTTCPAFKSKVFVAPQHAKAPWPSQSLSSASLRSLPFRCSATSLLASCTAEHCHPRNREDLDVRECCDIYSLQTFQLASDSQAAHTPEQHCSCHTTAYGLIRHLQTTAACCSFHTPEFYKPSFTTSKHATLHTSRLN